MKLRYFIRGLGAGIVFTSILLAIVLRSPEKAQLSDEEVKSRAVQMGMVDPTDAKMQEEIEKAKEDASTLTLKKETNTESDPKENKPESNKEDTTKNMVEGKNTQDTTDTKPKEEQTNKELNNSKKEPNEVAKEDKKDTSTNEKETVDKPQKIYFTIKSGMFSNHVANELERVGLIKDAKEFDQYLVKNGYQSKIIPGKFEINSSSTYDQIAKLITK